MYVLKLLGVHSGCIQLRPMHQLRNFANMLDIEIHVMNISKVGLLEILYFIPFALHVSELALIYMYRSKLFELTLLYVVHNFY